MSNDFLTTFLGTPSEDEQIILPTGGMSTGFVGELMAAVRYRVWSETEVDPVDWVQDGEGRQGFVARQTAKGSFFYYLANRPEAVALAESVGAYNPNHVWRYEMPTAKVLNFMQENPEASWGATIGVEGSIVTLRSKYRHEFHMIMLPAAIDALARRVGFLTERIFDLSELMNLDPAAFDDDLQLRMIGNSAKNYQDSDLWLARKDLWAALGEEDPTKCNPSGSGSKLDTESERLSQMLGIVTRPWVKPIWARMALVPDPRYDAEYGDEQERKRPSIPAILDIFPDEAAAVAVAAEEAGAFGKTDDKAPKGEGGLTLPGDWEGFEEEWRAELAGHKQAKGKGKDKTLPAIPVLKGIAEELSCEVDHVKAWWDQV